MAGRTLKYDYKIVKVVEGKEEKVAALLEANTGQEGFEVSFDGDDISIIVPQTMLFDPNAAMQKFRLVTVLRDAVDAGKVSFVEVHEPRVAATTMTMTTTMITIMAKKSDYCTILIILIGVVCTWKTQNSPAQKNSTIRIGANFLGCNCRASFRTRDILG